MPTVSVFAKNSEGKLIPSGEYKVQTGQVIFDQLDAQGVILPHGCLAGSCGSCRTIILSGNDQLAPKSAIETDTVNHLKSSYPQKYSGDTELRLTCRARIVGEGKIEILPG